MANYLSVQNFNNNIDLQINKYYEKHNISHEDYQQLKEFIWKIKVEERNYPNNISKFQFESTINFKKFNNSEITFKEYQARKVEYQKKYGD